jgi:hypothetical protein
MKKIFLPISLAFLGIFTVLGLDLYFKHYSGSQNRSQDDLVLHVIFDSKNIMAGKVIKDLSGKGNDGLIRGNVNWVEDISGSAFRFDGKTYIDCGNKDSLNLGNNLTLEAWIVPDDIITTHADARIIMKGQYYYGVTRDERPESNGYYAYINSGTVSR